MKPTRQSTYREEVDRLRIGDAIAFTGKKVYSKWIKRFTGEPTHVASYYGKDAQGRHIIVEAVEGHGVVASILEERVQTHDGYVDFYYLDEAIGGGNVSAALAEMTSMVGLEYSMFGAIFGGGLEYLLRFSKAAWKLVLGRALLKNMFCSKLVYRVLKVYGVPLKYLGIDETPTPSQVAKLACWKERVRVKPGASLGLEFGEPKEIS